VSQRERDREEEIVGKRGGERGEEEREEEGKGEGKGELEGERKRRRGEGVGEAVVYTFFKRQWRKIFGLIFLHRTPSLGPTGTKGRQL
jgi:hypothetical protein